MQLRYYQQAAYSAALAALRRGKHPVLQLATGTGKSLIIARVASTFDTAEPTWVLTHSQRLVEQNEETYYKLTGDRAGIVCSGLNRADFRKPVIFGTIQSMINPGLRGDLPAPGLIVIDEAHRIQHATGEQGMYGRLFQRYPSAARLAMTATPWRTDNGLIYGNDPERFWFNELAYKYTVPQGVADGYLCPLVGVETEQQLDLEGVAEHETDFVLREVGDRETAKWLAGVAQSVALLAARRNQIAVYCPTIASAQRAAAAISRATGRSCAVLNSGMRKADQVEVLSRFNSGELQVLCSVDQITTGFDHPPLDCIVCLRPTLSSSLWVQIMGRGTRLHASKKNCLLLDYVGNLQRLGGVDMLETYVREKGGTVADELEAVPAPPRPKRELLPGVRSLAAIDPTTGQQASNGSVLKLKVNRVSAVAITTRRNPRDKVLMVSYSCNTPENARIDASAFITTHLANAEAQRFFRNRRLAVMLPSDAQGLMWQLKGARMPDYVTAQKSGKYWTVTEEFFNQE